MSKMPRIFLLAIAVMNIGAAPVTLEIIPSIPRHEMKGGIGASMHCMEGGPGNCGGGSACGANPAPDDNTAWDQLYGYADWLGLDFCRVEVEQRMYEPGLDSFSFDNREMLVLYRWLDWCESREVDVFFQQMWARVSWGASDSVRAEGLATLMDHLIRVKGYTSIKWLCINNEPVQWWDWQRPLERGFAAVRKALDAKGLTNLPISGPDDYSWTGYTDAVRDSMNPFLGSFDMHRYGISDFNRDETQIPEWTTYAHAKNKPFFMSELGSAFQGFPEAYPGTWDANMPVIKTLIGGLNMGVDGFNRWSFTNRGDMDGEWQMIDTWDKNADTLLSTYTPHPDAFYLFGLISRFTALHSTVVEMSIDDHAIRKGAVEAACLKSPAGGHTLLVCNSSDSVVQLQTRFYALNDTARFYRYAINRATHANRSDIMVESDKFYPMAAGSINDLADTLPPQSLTVYSTQLLNPSEHGLQRVVPCSSCTHSPYTNIAKGKPILASSVYAGYPADYANDGLSYTRWSSQFLDSQWIRIDLGETMRYSAVMLHWDPAYAAQYELQESDNGTDWRTLLYVDSGKGNTEWFDNLNGKSRYVRLQGIVRATQYGLSLYDFAILSASTDSNTTDIKEGNEPFSRFPTVEVHPNPFNPMSTIILSLPAATHVVLEIHSVDGRIVRTLAANDMKAGEHPFTWDATDKGGRKVSAGIYIYKLRTGNRVLVSRAILAK